MNILYFLTFLTFLSFDLVSSTLVCEQVDVCKCKIIEDKDNSTVGIINLKSVGNAAVSDEDFQPRFDTGLVYNPDDYSHSYIFKYNPCYGFDVPDVGSGLSMTVEQDYTTTSDIGVQESENFQYDPSDDEFYLMYTSKDGARSSIVNLECALVLDGHELSYIKTSDAGFYTFTLKGPCACPDFCDDDGIIQGATLPPEISTNYPIPSAGCTKSDTCLCTMDDNTGVIDLRSLSKTDDTAMFEEFGSYWSYKFNPCSGFTYQNYSELAVLQYNSYSTNDYYDLGTISSAEFVYNPPFGIGLHYESKDREGEDLRVSTVYLVCDRSVHEHSFRFLNEYTIEEYPFVLQGPCACPGLCDENGEIGYTPPEETTISPDEPSTSYPETTLCEKQDSCSCEMADNSGAINLHSLSSSTSTPRWDHIDGNDGFLYSYNPCHGWTSDQSALPNLAVLQSSATNTFEEYDLGVQSSQYFTSTDDGDIRLVYKANDEERTSIVILVCERNEVNHELIFNGETIQTHYEFTLIGPCACPGVCNDQGRISAPDDNTDQVIEEAGGYWLHVNAAIASLVLHDLILVTVIVIIVLVLKVFFNITCCKRKPKYGNFT